VLIFAQFSGWVSVGVRRGCFWSPAGLRPFDASC
jgi:hypothetical protein